MTRLLSHYWTADDAPPARQAQIEDWLDDLDEFSVEAVREACAEWRRKDTAKRPTPGQIRALCREQVPYFERLPTPMPVDDDEAYRMANQWAINRGFMSIEHFQRESFVGASIRVGPLAWRAFPGLREVKPQPVAPSAPTAASLGVKAREWTPEEMRAGRIALGLEDDAG